MHRDLLEPFFRSTPEALGFGEDRAEDWTPNGDSGRGVVFQSRVLWVASTVAEAYPDGREAYLGHARHALRVLLDHLLDPADGAFRWNVDSQGRPQGSDVRRTYGQAFALFALSAAARVLGDEPLAAAQRLFGWLDAQARDPEFGGWFEAIRPDGTPYDVNGLKSHNTSLHLMEAFLELRRVWNDPRVTQRLEEAVRLVGDTFIGSIGASAEALARDLSHARSTVSYGHDLEAAHLLVSAGEALGTAAPASVVGLGRVAVEHGWDREHGGFFATGEPDGRPRGMRKIWWVQAEALLGLAALAPYGSEFADLVEPCWEFIERRHIDPVHRGWYGTLSREGEPLDGRIKADPWKSLYHETRALMETARRLRG